MPRIYPAPAGEPSGRCWAPRRRSSTLGITVHASLTSGIHHIGRPAKPIPRPKFGADVAASATSAPNFGFGDDTEEDAMDIGSLISALAARTSSAGVIGADAGTERRVPGDERLARRGLVSTGLGLLGALVGYWIFAGLFGWGDEDKFDWGGIVGARDRRDHRRRRRFGDPETQVRRRPARSSARPRRRQPAWRPCGRGCRAWPAARSSEMIGKMSASFHTGSIADQS